jgi:hypothetical protein
MLVFDKNRKRCVTPPTEDCEVPTTNAPNSDEEQAGGSAGDFTGESAPRPANTNPNPRRGSGAAGAPGPAGGRRAGGGGSGAGRPQGAPQPIALESSGPGVEPLPFNLPPGAVPLN